jgi:hypothetical protein
MEKHTLLIEKEVAGFIDIKYINHKLTGDLEIDLEFIKSFLEPKFVVGRGGSHIWIAKNNVKEEDKTLVKELIAERVAIIYY